MELLPGQDCVIYGLQAIPHYNGQTGIVDKEREDGRLATQRTKSDSRQNWTQARDLFLPARALARALTLQTQDDDDAVLPAPADRPSFPSPPWLHITHQPSYTAKDLPGNVADIFQFKPRHLLSKPV